MPRFEITGTATDVFTLEEIQGALRRAGAKSVKARRAYGWRNQPHVATFRAADDDEAKALCDRARNLLRPGSLPSLIPHEYA